MVCGGEVRVTSCHRGRGEGPGVGLGAGCCPGG